MGNYVSVEVDIDVDDYVENISFDVLLDEVLSRKPKNSKEEAKYKEVVREYFGSEDLFELISKVHSLNIVQSERLADFINNQLTI